MPELRLPGLRLHYRETGGGDEGEGEPVLLLHGLGNSGRDWEFQWPALAAAGYRVICPDLRGFGRSERPANGYRIEQFAADMRALLAALGIRRAHLAGYSMGGAVAYQLAVDEPERWISLCILNSVPSFRPERLGDYWQYLSRKWATRWFGMDWAAHQVTRRLFGERPALAAQMQPRYADNDPRVYAAMLQALAQWDVRAELPRIQCPVLVLAAEQDYFRLEDMRQGNQGLAHWRLEQIPGTRHGLPMEAPEAVNQRLLAFLSASSAACSRSAELV